MHELETDGSRTAFVTARVSAWHALGVTLDHSFTAAEAMEHAHLGGWNVRKSPLSATVIGDDGVDTLEVPERYATVRTSPFTGQPEVLGVVGEQYTPIQNEEHCDILDSLVHEGGAHFETAGSLRGGRQTFVTMKLPEHIEVGGIDRIDTYIAALNSHDGSRAFTLLVTPVRVVCANTQAAALRAARSSFQVRHTTNVRDTLKQARDALGLTFRYVEEFQVELEKMVQEQLEADEFMDLVRDIWPVEIGVTPSKRFRDREYTLGRLFSEAETQADVRNTRYAGYQAIVEFADHYAWAKTPAARAERVLTSPAVIELKQRAFDLLSV